MRYKRLKWMLQTSGIDQPTKLVCSTGDALLTVAKDSLSPWWYYTVIFSNGLPPHWESVVCKGFRYKSDLAAKRAVSELYRDKLYKDRCV